MPVPEEMRRIEDQIDTSTMSLPIWRSSKSVLLRLLLQHYRDSMEVLMIAIARAQMEQQPEEVRRAQVLEQRLRHGVFQALKWVMELATGKEKRGPSWEAIRQLVDLGRNYEIVVDCLKSAKYDAVTIKVDEEKRTVTIYEGGDLTGSDAQLVFSQHERLLDYSHVNLTHDDDQLTSQWNASQFRSAVNLLRDAAIEASDIVCINISGEMLPLFPRPTLVKIPDLADPSLHAVLEDLTLTSDNLRANRKWRLVSFIETPLVLIDNCRFGVSDILIALAEVGCYDTMLRVASRVDPQQYSRISGLREQRMMELCREEFSQRGWHVETGKRISGPLKREIDVIAHRGDTSVLIQLKSTLRPETPWEVFKRNEHIHCGIQHTSEVASLLRQQPVPFIITDGYRGDYATWSLALEKEIPIGTLRDLPDIAADPISAIELLKQRVGFDSSPPAQSLPDRSFEIMGWKIVLTDAGSNECV